MAVSTKAFTLIELLVVVALIGILSAIGIVAFTGTTDSAAQKAAENTVQSMALAQLEYRSNNQVYYGTPGNSGSADCTASTTTAVNTNLFGGTQTSNLDKQKFFFCSFSKTSVFINFAKHKEKPCQISLNNINELNFTNC
jgi:prepilin-type N-terminal cleavage/methylation domain-containing protein